MTSKFHRIFFLQKKNEVTEKLRKFLTEVETVEYKVHQFLSDGKREFNIGKFWKNMELK